MSDPARRITDHFSYDSLRDRTRRPPFFFIARAGELASEDHPGWPFDTEIAWTEKHPDDVTGEWTEDLDRQSSPNPQMPPIWPAAYLCPPASMLITATAKNGDLIHGYQPTVHVMGAKITEVYGGPDAQYKVKSFDHALEFDDLTPIDRWNGIEYVARKFGDVVMVMCEDHNTAHLLAFETPTFVDCDEIGASAAEATPTRSLVARLRSAINAFIGGGATT